MKNCCSIITVLFAGLTLLSVSNPAVSETVIRSPEPLTLRKIMQNLGKEMAVIAEAIAREEWDQVEKSALRIADHPRPPVTERMKIMALLGEDMRRFKAYDAKTHDTARVLAEEAAAKKQSAAIVSTFATLQNSCLACHQNFRKPLQEKFYGTLNSE
jgi:cytochrome c556